MAEMQTEAPHPRSATMQDVADKVNVSRALVSMAFRGLKGVSPETREAIFEAAKELGYRHNAMAARLAAGRTNTVGLFLLDIHNEVFADIFTGLRTQEESMGSKVVLAVGNPAAKTELEEINNLLNVRVEALILAGSLLPDKAIIDIARAVPTVAVTRLGTWGAFGSNR